MRSAHKQYVEIIFFDVSYAKNEAYDNDFVMHNTYFDILI